MNTVRGLATALLLVVWPVTPAMSAPGAVADAEMQGLWQLEAPREGRCEGNLALAKVEPLLPAGEFRGLCERLDPEAGMLLRVEPGSLALVVGELERRWTYRHGEYLAEGFVFEARAEDGTGAWLMEARYQPAGRMTWTDRETGDVARFRRILDPDAILGWWTPDLQPEQRVQLESARRALEASPDDANARRAVETLWDERLKTYLQVTRSEMIRTSPWGQETRSTYRMRSRGGRLELTTVDEDGAAQIWFVVVESLPRMTWTSADGSRVLRWRLR
jgi:hypothetical protein